MYAETAGEQSVAVGDVNEIVLCRSRRHKSPRGAFRPYLYVMMRVPDDRLLSGGAGGRVYALELGRRHGEHTIRVVVAEILLICERELLQVVHREDVLRLHTRLVHALSVHRDVLVGVIHGA